jgi:hypothetical protein
VLRQGSISYEFVKGEVPIQVRSREGERHARGHESKHVPKPQKNA